MGTRLAIVMFVLILIASIAGSRHPTTASAMTYSAAMATEIDQFVTGRMDESRIPGVALTVIRDGEIVHSRGYGETSDDGRSVTPQTPFIIGSTTKSITALAVMQLVDAGQINLDAPVQSYIPWFSLADEESSARITVRHLLIMSSGIPADAGGEAFRSTVDMTPAEAVRTLRSAPLAFEPGSEFEYVNANYVVLGLLIETVSGLSYSDYLQEHIFTPLEMRHSYTDPAAARLDGFADGHRYWFGWPVAYDTPYLQSMVPAGYVISTAEDLSNYLTMFLNEGVFNGQQIVSPAGIAELQRGVHEFPLGPWAKGATSHYAMGWLVGGPWGEEPTIFHPGGAPSFTATLHLKPDLNLGVVTLTNSGNYIPLPGAQDEMRQIPRGVMDLLTGQEPASSAGLHRFYLYFDLIVLTLVTFQIIGLVRLLRRRMTATSPGRLFHSGVPLFWELGLGALILWSPNLFDGWRHAWVWTPDLALTLLVIGSLWMATGLVRVVRIALAAREHVRDPIQHATPAFTRKETTS